MAINLNHVSNNVATEGTNLSFTVGASERLRITSNGGLSMGATGTAVGTAGQVLQSNGDTTPTWVNGVSTGKAIAMAMIFGG